MSLNSQQTKIVIIGGGVAGLSCAIELRKHNIHCTVIEKNILPYYKVCAGGVTRKILQFKDFPQELLTRSFKEIYITFNKNKVKIPSNNDQPIAYTISRTELSRHLYEKALKSGVKVTFESAIKIDLEQKYIETKTKKISFEILIGADGANSIVRKALGLKTRDIHNAFQYIAPKHETHNEFEARFAPEIDKNTFIWIFPHRDIVSIGTGAHLRINPKIKKLRERFDNWLHQSNITTSKATFETALINFDYKGYKFNDTFLIGDASGITLGISGEGIYSAILSAKRVALEIASTKNKEAKKELAFIKKLFRIWLLKKRFLEINLNIYFIASKMNLHLHLLNFASALLKLKIMRKMFIWLNID